MSQQPGKMLSKSLMIYLISKRAEESPPEWLGISGFVEIVILTTSIHHRQCTEELIESRRAHNAKSEKSSGAVETFTTVDSLLDEMIERLDGDEAAKVNASAKEEAEKRMAHDMRLQASGQLPPPFKLGDSDEESNEDDTPTKERRRKSRKKYAFKDNSLETHMGSFLRGTTSLMESRLDDAAKKSAMEQSRLKIEDDKIKLEFERLKFEREKYEMEAKFRDQQAQQQSLLLTSVMKLLERSQK